VDGGMEYLRRVGDVENMEEMSYTMNNNIVNDCVAAIKWGKDTKRNDLGIALAVLRALKKHNKLVLDHE
jgi:hypothetical protein